MMLRCWLVILAVGFNLIPGQVWALDLGGVGLLGGSYRNLFVRTEDSRGETINTDLNRLRLELQGSRGPLSWDVVYDHEVLVGGFVKSPDFATLQATRDRTYLDLDDTVSRGGDYEWRHRLYRATLRWEHPYGDVVIGRQRIAWGSGRLWNPTDRFNPVDPTAVERTEKTGVDGVLLTFKRGPFGALQLVGAPGRKERGVPDRVAARWRDTVGVTDYALLVGSIDDEIVAGGDLTTNLLDGNLRLEVLHGEPDNNESYTQAVVGYDYRLTTALFPAGLYLLAEYFYNGAATTAVPSIESSRLESRSHHLLGLAAGYDLTPLWRLDGLAIVDLERGSHVFVPRLTWSVTSHVNLSVAVQVFGGASGSEFGDRKDLYLMQLDMYF